MTTRTEPKLIKGGFHNRKKQNCNCSKLIGGFLSMEGFRHRFSGLFSVLRYFAKICGCVVPSWLMPSIPNWSPHWVLGQDNLLSVPLSTQVKMGTCEFNAGVLTLDGLASFTQREGEGTRNSNSRFMLQKPAEASPWSATSFVCRLKSFTSWRFKTRSCDVLSFCTIKR